MSVTFNFHEKQFDVLDTTANEVLFGGAAGAGKSWLLRAIAIAVCLDVPGAQIYIFRRNYPDLVSNHMSGSGSFPEMLGKFVESGQCKINVGDMDIKWTNGSAIHLRHVSHESDAIKYQGMEATLILFDELTHFSEYIYRFLRSRVRLGGLLVKDRWKDKLPGIISASNPGNVGHAFVKRMFIDNCPPFEIRQMPPEEGGMRRQFIPAKLSDNPTLTENDPLYATRLSGLGSPELVKAMLDGDWDIVAGAALEKLNRKDHMIRTFTPLKHWTKFMAIDWGTAKPSSVGWYCVPDTDVVLAAKQGKPEKLIPKNSIIRYREMYGWNGKPDEGSREESWRVAQKILCHEYGALDFIKEIDRGKNVLNDLRIFIAIKENYYRSEKIDYRIGDSAMWAQHDGPSVAEKFAENGLVLEQCKKDRISNYQELRNRVSPPQGGPGLYVTENCVQFWRTVPELQLDQREPEKGPDTRQEDHVYDELVYGINSRPLTWTREKRLEGEYDDARKRAFDAERHGKTGRYS